MSSFFLPVQLRPSTCFGCIPFHASFSDTVRCVVENAMGHEPQTYGFKLPYLLVTLLLSTPV